MKKTCKECLIVDVGNSVMECKECGKSIRLNLDFGNTEGIIGLLGTFNENGSFNLNHVSIDPYKFKIDD